MEIVRSQKGIIFSIAKLNSCKEASVPRALRKGAASSELCTKGQRPRGTAQGRLNLKGTRRKGAASPGRDDERAWGSTRDEWSNSVSKSKAASERGTEAWRENWRGGGGGAEGGIK